jgi:putative ubiquitin-RnfH superfamily antitoxin RatB of RatAB toxin-antitoxin module
MELPIYKLRTKDSKGNIAEKQAIDMEALNSYLDGMMEQLNPLLQDPSKIEDGLTVKQYMSMVDRMIIVDLNNTVKTKLGIIKQELEPEPVVEDKKKVEVPRPELARPVPKKQPAPKPELDDELQEEPEAEGDDIITLE